MQALAVDNEPTPFWGGTDEVERIATWMTAVGWTPVWGSVAPVGKLNGPSGLWVQTSVLDVLGIDRPATWITDALDTYRCSTSQATVLSSVYQPFADAHRLPRATLAGHPTENQIVAEALSDHRQRLLQELSIARPRVVVTLGNAALRVFRDLLDEPAGPIRLAADDGYATVIDVSVHGSRSSWLPLAHPAAPEAFQVRHRAWAASRPGTWHRGG